jgi:O-antigen ligase
MSATVRALAVAAVVAVATLGEGGGSAQGLLATHLLLATAFAVAAVAFPAATHVPSRGPSFAWLAFALLLGAGAVAAPYAYAAWLVVVEIVAFGTLAWLASADPSAVARVLPWVVALLASGHGLTAVVQKLSGSPRPASSFLNPNHLAAWLAGAALLLAGALIAREAKLRERIALGAAVAIALAGIFVTGSRGAVAGLAVGAAMLVVLRWGGLTPRARRGALAASLTIVLVLAAGVALRFRGADDPYRFHRTKIWRASLAAVLAAPLTGTGPGQFAAAAPNLNFPLDDAALRFERAFRTPHSDVLRTVCEFGLPAGLAALAAILLAARECFRRRAELSAAECGALAALSGLLAQACVDDLTTRPAITLFGAALAGWLLARPRVPAERPASRAGTVAAAVLVVAALGVGEVAGYMAWSVLRPLPRGRLDAGQLLELTRAIAWNPMLPDAWARLAEHFVGDGRSWSAAEYAAAREAVEHARRLQPMDSTYAREAARVEANACLTIFPFEATRDRARQLYREAARLARTDATIPLEAAKFLYQAGDAGGARRAATEALAVEPRAVVPRLWLAQAILRQEGPAGAAQARGLLDEALALAPKAGEAPKSPYDAALRALDPGLVESIRREVSGSALGVTTP